MLPMLPNRELEIFLFLTVPDLEGTVLLTVPLDGVDFIPLDVEMRVGCFPFDVVVAVPVLLPIRLAPWGTTEVLLLSWFLWTT